jgi:hypothetical protein
MVVGHEGVWVVSGFLDKWEGEREKDAAKEKKKNLLSLSLRVNGRRRYTMLFQNDTVLGFFLYEQWMKRRGLYKTRRFI